jgi:tetratricopeptide (TPR) repeat protein
METFLMNIEANVHLDKTEYSDARCIQEAILHQTSVVLSPLRHAHALFAIAALDLATGTSADIVIHNLEAVETLLQHRKYLHRLIRCDYIRADLRLREGDAMGARAEYIRLFAATRDHDPDLSLYCLAKLGDPTEPVHDEMECARWAIVFFAFALHPVVQSTFIVHRALRRLGDVLVQQGAYNAALNILAIALDRFTQMDVHQSRAECMRTIGDVYVRYRDLYKAREIWEVARPLFVHSEQTKEVARIDERLQMLGIAQKLEAVPKAELPSPRILLQESHMKEKNKSL